jgi:hypothetical protein
MWIGAAFYAAGLDNWAGMFTAATDPTTLDVATSTALVAQLNTDTVRMWAASGGGAALVALGTVLLAIGLLRARTVPRWIPIVAGVSILATFLVPIDGVTGLLVEGPVAISGIAVGWYAWQRWRSRVGAGYDNDGHGHPADVPAGG